jgi:hypothetical protein
MARAATPYEPADDYNTLPHLRRRIQSALDNASTSEIPANSIPAGLATDGLLYVQALLEQYERVAKGVEYCIDDNDDDDNNNKGPTRPTEALVLYSSEEMEAMKFGERKERIVVLIQECIRLKEGWEKEGKEFEEDVGEGSERDKFEELKEEISNLMEGKKVIAFGVLVGELEEKLGEMDGGMFAQAMRVLVLDGEIKVVWKEGDRMVEFVGGPRWSGV